MLAALRSVLRFRRFHLSSVKRRLARAACVEDLRRIARKRLPGGVFDYIDGGAEDELALDRNTRAFRELRYRPRVLRDVDRIDTSTVILGEPAPMPLILAPTGFTRIAHPDGELAVARAAARAGLPYALSTLGTRSTEEISAVSTGRKWFQVYVWRDRGLVTEMIDRAAASGFEALCVTVDSVVLGRRERDVRRGFTLPPKIGLDTIFDGLRHPGWTWQFVRSEPILFPMVTGHSGLDGTSAVALSRIVNEQFDASLSWSDIEWLKAAWDGPVLVKGVQTTDDAVMARDLGLAGVILSNHGGRQLDSAPAVVDLVAPVADAVGDDLDVICDGGIRRGGDIVKAVALGATACMAGRSYLYGLGAAGEPGVDWVVEHLRAGMKRDMALCGVTSVAELTNEIVEPVARGSRTTSFAPTPARVR